MEKDWLHFKIAMIWVTTHWCKIDVFWHWWPGQGQQVVVFKLFETLNEEYKKWYFKCFQILIEGLVLVHMQNK